MSKREGGNKKKMMKKYAGDECLKLMANGSATNDYQ